MKPRDRGARRGQRRGSDTPALSVVIASVFIVPGIVLWYRVRRRGHGKPA